MNAKSLFSVCPHDTTKNLAGWMLVNTYLQQRLDTAIHFEPYENFEHERKTVLDGNYNLVYANPFSAGIFREKLGFIPIARPTGVFDETIVVARAGEGIPKRSPIKIASATNKLIVHTLGLTVLKELNIPVSQCEFEFVGKHLLAAQAVINEKADLGFVFNETWTSLNETSHKMLEVVGQTKSGHAYHCFCVSPAWADKCAQLQSILCGMKDDPKGKRVLDELGFSGFEPVEENGLDSLIVLMNESPG